MIPDPDSRLFKRLMAPEFRPGLGLGLPVGGYGAPAASFSFLYGDTLDGRITFTRASSGTRVNSAGIVELVDSDVARFDYDPVTMAPMGLLIEQQRTNVLTNSGSLIDFNFANRTNNVSMAPDGTNTATLVKSSVGDTAAGGFSFTFAAAAQTSSVFLKGADTATTYIGTYNTVSNSFIAFVRIDWTAGVPSVGSISGTGTVAINPFLGGWYRFELTCTGTSGDNGILFIYPESSSNPANTGKGLYVWGAQLEDGAFASSYIPTISVQATRAADLAVVSGGAFSSWFNPIAGTIFCEFDLKSVANGVNNPFLTVSNGTAANRIAFSTSASAASLIVASGSVVQANLSLGNVAAMTTTKVAAAYATDDFAAVFNGGTLGTDTAGTVPTIDRLSIGSFATGMAFMSGHIRRIDYYNRRLPKTDLQRITV